MPYSAVLCPDLVQQGVHLFGQAFLSLALLEIDLAAGGEQGVDQPGIELHQLGKFLGHLAVGGEVGGFAAGGPAGVKGGNDRLVQALQHFRHAGGKVVVEQDGAGVVVVEAKMIAPPHHRFQHQAGAAGQVDGGGLGDVRDQAADAHFQARLAQDVLQRRHVLQVEGVAGVVLRDHQEAAGVRAHLFHRRHGGLDAQGQEIRIEVVEAAGKQVGVHRRQLEAGVAQVHRGVEGGGMLLPLGAEPMLRFRHGVQDMALQLQQGAGKGGGQMGNHRYCGRVGK